MLIFLIIAEERPSTGYTPGQALAALMAAHHWSHRARAAMRHQFQSPSARRAMRLPYRPNNEIVQSPFLGL